MATLFGVNFAATIGAAFAGKLRSMTLHKVAAAISAAGDTVAVSVDHPCEGVVTKWDAAVAARKGYTPATVKVLILQRGLAAVPGTDDELTAAGARWRVVDVMQDAGEATWSLAAIKAAGA